MSVFARERERAQVGEGAKGKGGIDSLLSRESNPGLNPCIPRLYPEPKPDRQLIQPLQMPRF